MQRYGLAVMVYAKDGSVRMARVSGHPMNEAEAYAAKERATREERNGREFYVIPWQENEELLRRETLYKLFYQGAWQAKQEADEVQRERERERERE